MHVIPTRPGVKYYWVVVSTRNDVPNIRITTVGMDLKVGDIIPSVTDVKPHSAGTLFHLSL